MRLVNNNGSQGELQFFDAGDWLQVCSGAVDYIAAQLACQELGYSFVNEVRNVQE